MAGVFPAPPRSVQIGELVLELEAAQTVRTQEGAEVRLPDDGKSKTDAVADAGLSKYL
jgi:hypothetical protein